MRKVEELRLIADEVRQALDVLTASHEQLLRERSTERSRAENDSRKTAKPRNRVETQSMEAATLRSNIDTDAQEIAELRSKAATTAKELARLHALEVSYNRAVQQNRSANYTWQSQADTAQALTYSTPSVFAKKLDELPAGTAIPVFEPMFAPVGEQCWLKILDYQVLSDIATPSGCPPMLTRVKSLLSCVSRNHWTIRGIPHDSTLQDLILKAMYELRTSSVSTLGIPGYQFRGDLRTPYDTTALTLFAGNDFMRWDLKLVYSLPRNGSVVWLDVYWIDPSAKQRYRYFDEEPPKFSA